MSANESKFVGLGVRRQTSRHRPQTEAEIGHGDSPGRVSPVDAGSPHPNRGETVPPMSERLRPQNFTNRLLDAGGSPSNAGGKVNSVKTDPSSKPASALPLKTVAEELAFLRKSFKDLVTAYASQIEAEITQLHSTVTAEADS